MGIRHQISSGLEVIELHPGLSLPQQLGCTAVTAVCECAIRGLRFDQSVAPGYLPLSAAPHDGLRLLAGMAME